MKTVNNIYYTVKPLIPRSLQIALRRRWVRAKLRSNGHLWPIDERAGLPPPGWRGWPGENKFALVLTHDVDTSVGHERCLQLQQLEKQMGFRSSFNFVPERYSVSSALRKQLRKDGFEVGVHGLLHDGKLYRSLGTFLERACRINGYLAGWQAVGFRSPAMHHNLAWLHNLNIEYDSSTFDTDPFEPDSRGAVSIFPFWVKPQLYGRGYVELPYTLPQDFTLFVLMKEDTINIWKKKLDWIASRGGMALLNTHPDYMQFNGNKPGLTEYPFHYYSDFLNYVKTSYSEQYWNGLPCEVSRFFHEKQVKHFPNLPVS